MTTKHRSRRGAKTVATLDIESKIAKSKRELQGVKRAISQVKREEVSRRGGDLFGKMPSMFVSVPAMLGGAEAYFQEITSATPRAFDNAFGKNKGSRQLQLEAFKAFEKVRDHDSKDQVDYITLASTIVPLMAYNLCQAIDVSVPNQKAEVVDVITAYTTAFSVSGSTIATALTAAKTQAGRSTTPSIKAFNKESLFIYPLNPAYIKARDTMMNSFTTSADNKAKFLLKTEVLAAYRKYASKNEPPMSVAVPSQITEAVKSSLPADKATDLVKYFRDSSSLSLEDSFNFYRNAFNAISSTHNVRKSQEIAKGLKLLDKAFNKFIEELSNSMYDESVDEARAIKSEVMELVQDNATAEDFTLAQAILTQAQSSAPLVLNSGSVDEKTLESLGYTTFTSLELIDLLGASTNISPADQDVKLAFEKVVSLLKELTDESVSVADQLKIKDALDDAITESRAISRLSTLDSSFQTFANGTLTDIVDGIVTSFNSGFTESVGSWSTYTKIKDGVLDVVNAMFRPYTDGGSNVVDADSSWKLQAIPGVVLSEAALLDLAEGESLDIYIESETDANLDEFASSEAELAIENLKIAFSAAGVRMTQFVELENFLRDCGLEAQGIFDSMHMEASRREDIAIFRNPGSFSTLTQVGIGALSLVGTHATTALAQRFLNKEGKTEGTKFYAAEYVPAVIAAGAGAYMYHKEDRPDIGIPLIGGAIGSVLLRFLTRKFVNSDNFASKYILGYLGAAPAELLGDKTLGRIDLKDRAKLLEEATANAQIVGFRSSQNKITLTDGEVKAMTDIASGSIILKNDKSTREDLIKAFKSVKAANDILKGVIEKNKMAPLTDAEKQSVSNILEAGKSVAATAAAVIPGLNQIFGENNATDAEPVNGYIEDANTSGYQYPQMYAAPAGMGKYVSTPMHDPFYSYNPPTEIMYSQAQSMLNKGYQLAGYDQQEAMEIIQTAQPLTASELHAEGLSGYINETIIRATPASAHKLQSAGVASTVGQSSLVPNSYLMRIGTTGEEGGIAPEYNPSLPSGVFAPQEIEPAQYEESVTSGLFSRGAFASRLPTAEDGFDY